MGIACPKCKSKRTYAKSVGLMICRNCSHSWRPYKHRGKKMKTIGDGLLYPRKRIMPGSKTRSVGDNILFRKRRVKKIRRRRSIFGF